MRQKLGLVAALAACAALVLASPSSGVLFGEPDGSRHPQVGLVVFYGSSGAPVARCTGTLLSATVLLTAGHCTDGAAAAQIWLDPGPIPRGTWTGGPCGRHRGFPCSGGASIGRAFTYPGFDLTQKADTGDVGVVLLKTAIKGVAYGQLAPVGYLDALATRRGTQDTRFEVVGYGVQSVRPDFSALRERYRAEVSLVSLASALTDGHNVQHTGDPGSGTGSGGLCNGDSGSPLFHPTGLLQITAVGSFVLSPNCQGAGFSFRVDKAPIQGWIRGFFGK